MLSWPPATRISIPSATICFAAAAMAVKPDAHWRSIVCAGAVTGIPAANAALRATFIPAVPAVSTVPMTTSSISPGSMRARSTAWRMTWDKSVGDLMLLSAPRNALPIGVRAVETMTASLMAMLLDESRLAGHPSYSALFLRRRSPIAGFLDRGILVRWHTRRLRHGIRERAMHRNARAWVWPMLGSAGAIVISPLLVLAAGQGA